MVGYPEFHPETGPRSRMFRSCHRRKPETIEESLIVEAIKQRLFTHLVKNRQFFDMIFWHFKTLASSALLTGHNCLDKV